MEEKGYLLLVLNTHLPFVRHPEIEHMFEENWLFEAIVESYLPVLSVCEDLIRDETDFRLTFSLSPPLLSMLGDELLQRRFVSYLQDRISLSEKETERLRGDWRLCELAQAYRKRFVTSRKLFAERWNSNLISAFKYLLASGKVEIITSSATHAYLPLCDLFPRIVRLQLKLGMLKFREAFGRNPLGFWLPECGYYQGLDVALHREGVGYFFMDAHGLLNGEPRPKFGEYAPVQCPSGVAAFGRDLQPNHLVWFKEKGYPGDPVYRDFHQDIGYELDRDYLFPFTHCTQPIPTGMKYFRGTTGGQREIYDSGEAQSRCDEHANHFVSSCQRQAEHLHHSLGKKPVVTALFDTEHFGHWWHEGPTWLNLALRKFSHDQKTVKLVTAREYLELHPINQIVNPSMSSWGYQGYSETWLMGRNHWVYPALYEMIELLDPLVESVANSNGLARDALNQYFRELLLAQSSDWAFMMHAQSAQVYAEKRVRDHLENMTKLYHQIIQNIVDPDWLERIRQKNNIFANIDILELYNSTA